MAFSGAEGNHVYLVSAKVETAQEVQGWTVLKRFSRIQQKMQQFQGKTSRSHTFKLVGEPLILAVLEVSVGHIASFDATMKSLFVVPGVTYECEVLTSHEQFARERLGVSDLLTMRESDDYLANISTLLWCQNTLNFEGKSVGVMKDAWKNGATVFLEERIKNGGMCIKSEIFKVVGKPKIHAFVSMNPHELDMVVFQRQANPEYSGAVVGVVKVVTMF